MTTTSQPQANQQQQPTNQRSTYLPTGLTLTAHRPVIKARKGMITSAHYAASMAGLRMFVQGGNAVDAIVAAAAALNVVEAYMSGIGGIGMLVMSRLSGKERKAFNFTGLGQKKGEREKKKASAEEKNPKTGAPVRLSELVPARVRIEDGEVTLQSNDQKPVKVQGIDLSIEDFSTGQSFPYRAALRLPGLKPVVLEGLGSYSESEASFSLKENRLKVQGVDFAVNGAVTRLTAAPQADLTLSNAAFETKPIFQLLSETGLMPKGSEISGPMGLRVSVKGPFDRMTASVNIDLKKLQVNDPRAFKGVLTGKVQLSLPLGGKAPVAQLLQGSGKVTAQDGVLTNVDLLSKIQLLTGIIGVPGDQSRGATTFKSLESEFTLGGGIVEFQRLFLASPLLEARGGGKMALSPPSLDLSIETALSPEISARAGSGKATTFFKDDQGRLVTPLKVRGPVNRPSVDLDKEKLVRKGLGQLLERGPGQLFERFFKKK